MFWRKKNDGFEWHKYVRTTIKLRREDRRRRVKAAKDAAIEGLDNAGRAGIAAGRTGVLAVAAAAVAGARASARWLIYSAGVMVGAGWRASVAAFRATRRTLASGLARASTAAASGWRWSRRKVPLLTRVPDRVAAGVAIAIAAVCAGYIALLSVRSLPATGLPNPLAFVPGLGSTVVEGRAAVIDGGTLRVNGQLVRLAGIEAPELDQRCGNRTATRCGTAAQSALRDLLRSRPVRCEASGTDDSGRILAVCSQNGRDLAAELTAKGMVFAQEGLFSRYGAREREAREAKLGLWRANNPERPKAYRDRRWEEARRAAPEGCPIKGHLVGKDRRYVLPWSPQYESVRVREARGGRWFCSENEARAAGWRPV